MLIRPLRCAVDYVTALNASLQKLSVAPLTRTQGKWLVTVLMGIIVTKRFNWAAFARRSQGESKESQLRWVFRHANIPWAHLLKASVAYLLSYYDITKGVLVLDDSDKMRSRNTSKIAGVHKVKDKKTGGWFNGQEFVFLLFVTKLVTIPVGFRFYRPDPALAAWRKTYKAQKKAGVPSKARAKYPAPNPKYPSKQMLGVKLLKKFAEDHPDITVQAVLADALYGNRKFMDKAVKVAKCAQVISQLRRNQLIRSRGRLVPLTTYFARSTGVQTQLTIRGGESKSVTMLASRVVVKAHGKKRFVIALKYEGETDYRFIVATDLTWRHKDVTQAYTLRWLVEVFIADWKGHGGWATLSKQHGDEGAAHGVALSLLCDHLLLVHPLQSASFKNKQPGISVGCLIEHINAEALVDGVTQIVRAEEPQKELEKFKCALEESLVKRKSSKHLAGRKLGRMEPTPSLLYQKAA